MSDFVLQEPQQEQPQENKKNLNFISREHMLFATPFWQTKVEGVDNEPIKKYCYEMRDKTEGVVISNRGGWHSKEILQPIPNELQNFFNQVVTWSNNYCAQITGITDLVLGNWWVNINPPGTYNRRHDHQKSILSGVYYVDCEGENIGELVVERDDNMEFFTGRYQNSSPICMNTFRMLPYTGFLLMFPKNEIIYLDMTFEEASKFIVSAGTSNPK